MDGFTKTHIEPLKEQRRAELPDYRNKKIRIAIIDSGVDTAHPRIRGAIKSGRIKVCRNFLSFDHEDYDDDFGHGTWVALLLLQVAPEAEIYVAKVADSQSISKSKVYCIAEVGVLLVSKLEVHMKLTHRIGSGYRLGCSEVEG